MYVSLHMTSPAVTVPEELEIGEVREILRERKFRHLPVVDGDHRLVGMVTDRDVRSALPSTILTEAESRDELTRMIKTPVRAIMSTRLLTLTPSSTLDDALYLLDRERVGALPVVDEKRCVLGIFSIRDLLRAYNQLFGLGERGSALIAIEDDGKPRLLTRIVRAMEEHDIHFSRLVRESGKEKEKGGLIYLRVSTINVRAVHTQLQEAGLTVAVPKLSAEAATKCPKDNG